MADPTYTLGQAAAKQLAETVRRVRQMPPAGPARGRRRDRTPNLPIKLGVLTQTLTYATTTGAACNRYTGAPGSETPDGITDTVYEWMLRPGESIVAGSQVVYGKINGNWYVIAAQCPAAGS